MTSKHVFNKPENLVLRSLRGAVILNPALRLHGASKAVYVSREAMVASKARVSVISGGGAGHEPAHAGYTGIGMLSSSVSGDIFASPSASQIRTAIDLAIAVSPFRRDVPKEVLLVVNNYTGDRLNFGLAAESARSRGIDVATVIVADDVAVGKTPLGLVGRRGLAGNILVCKIIGAAAERGLPLKAVAALGNAVTENLASIGLSLDHCHVPGKGKESGDWEKLEENACELGLGLHNEKGVKRLNETPDAREMVSMMLKPLLDRGDSERAYVAFSQESQEDTILFINNLGGLSQLEVGAVVEEVFEQLWTLNIHPCRVYSSSYMTSLNAPGFSISLLNISSANRTWRCIMKNEGVVPITELLDDPTDALAWIGVHRHWPCRGLHESFPRNLELEERQTEELLRELRADAPLLQIKQRKNNDPDFVKTVLHCAAQSILKAEAELTYFDTVCGDGDCGTTMAAGVLNGIKSSTIDLDNAPQTALDLAKIFEGVMGGTSGALFSIFFTSLSASLQTTSWRSACLQALEALKTYTPARPGDRTLVDSLEPFCTALQSGSSPSEAAEAAQHGAERTRGMTAKLGRAVYVGTESNNVPDPGAWGLMSIARGIAQAFEN